MTAGSNDAEARASQEATDWLILLQDDPDDLDLRRRFDAWLAASPIHAAAWSVTQHTAGMLAQMPPTHVDQWDSFLASQRAGDGGNAHALRASARQPRRAMAAGSRRNWQLGFSFAVAAGLAFVLAPGVLLYLRADYTTSTAQTRTIALSDGSSVALAPDSAISVAYTGGERRINLLAGEAFFTVNHNPDRPFRVAAGSIETTDIGTSFDIRRNDEGATIAVQQGIVRVDDSHVAPPISETLTAGQSVRVAWAGGIVRADEPPTQIAAWRQNQLIAQDQPMREVVDQLRPYFAGKIILTDSALGDRPVTGVYNLADPVEALRGVARAHGATVRQITPWILLISGD